MQAYVVVLFHLAEGHRWESSLASGRYTASTRGLELDEVGFIHLCTAAQLAGVAARFYRGVDGLLLLHIDPERCGAPIVFEPVGDSDELFPHLYGPLPVGAVVRIEPFDAPDAD